MSFIVTFIAAVFVFSAVLAIHEFGHFMVAKLCGVQVNEFSIGMGPVLCKRVRKGTQYSIRALPVGGFVALEGEESPEREQAEGESGDDDAPDIPPEVLAQRTGKPLNEAAVWQRMLVMAAGAVMNFVLGFVVLVVLIAAQIEPITSKTIYAIQDGALCGQTGLQAAADDGDGCGDGAVLADDALDPVLRPDTAPVLRREFRVGKRLGEPVAHRPRGRPEPHRLQLLRHLLGLSGACLARFLRVDCLQHARRGLPPGHGNPSQHVAGEMHRAALVFGVREHLAHGL